MQDHDLVNKEDIRKVALKVYIDEDSCIGCGTCEGICPEVFRLNEEEGKSEVIKPEGGPEGSHSRGDRLLSDASYPLARVSPLQNLPR